MDRKPLKPPAFWIILFLVLALIGFLPEILINLTTPENMVYSGALINSDDISVYLSVIRQGAQGSWLFTPQFSPEPIPTQAAYLPFILVGKLQNIFGGSTLLWFQMLRIISLTAAGTALKGLIETIYPTQTDTQKTAWMLLLFGSGLGWLVGIIAGGFSALTPDLFAPEWNLLTALFSSPHFLLGIAGQAWLFSFFLRAYHSPNKRNLIGGIFSAVLISAAYPFLAPVDGLIIAIFFLVLSIRTKKIPWKQLGTTLLQSIPLIIILVYYGLVLPQDPLWEQTLLSNNLIPPPPLAGLLIGYGLLGLLAAVNVFAKPVEWHEEKVLLICWLGCNLISLYLPLSFAGRLVMGLFIPVILLAAEGLERVVLPWVKENSVHSRREAIRHLVILFSLPSTLLLAAWALKIGVTVKQYPYYFSQEDIRAVEFLAKQTTSNDLVLADYPLGNYIPRESQARVFAGHLNLTVNLDEKLSLISTFWHPETTEQWRENLIKDWGITYIFQSPSHTAVESGKIPGTVIYQHDGISIYQID